MAQEINVPRTGHENRLAREKSPYLLQHAKNPVDWFPWSEEAFRKARDEGKPVLLSIGYSTCHWCHVMERESFEDEDTAALMNKFFVSVKVDREERPDLDSVYMNYVMATTGSGGWPMTVFLTPEGKPFYGGTYFPPTDRFGMPGFRTILTEIAEAWRSRRSEIDESAESAVKYLSGRRESAARASLGEETLYAAFERMKSGFDERRGGFGRAPKFPRSHALSLLLRYWHRAKNPEALGMAVKTLDEMAKGGLHDQLGGGFHRYSTDAVWRVPHFEKMLYDQALLARTYVEAWQATGEKRHADVARKTLDYVLREMTHPEGGFYSAQDADSEDPHAPGKKREGAYFVWRRGEIEKLFPAPDAALFSARFGVENDGNAVSDPHGEFKGENVLYEAMEEPEAAAHAGVDPKEAGARLAGLSKRLLEERAKRKAPHLDDKVLADWNGLMIDAFAYAGASLDEPRYAEAAARAARFVLSKLKKKDGKLLHRFRDGDAAIEATLNDYASLAVGLLALYEATLDEAWLAEARALADVMVRDFWDKEGKGFFLTAHDAEKLVSRPKELYDGAVPSGNSYAVLALTRLDRITGDGKYGKCADEALASFSAEIAAEPTAYPQMLAAFDLALGPSQEIVIAGDPKAAAPLLEAVRRPFLPRKVVLAPNRFSEYTKDMKPAAGTAAAYVCVGHACSLPASTPDEVRQRLTQGA